jgi:hypothetical protein
MKVGANEGRCKWRSFGDDRRLGHRHFVRLCKLCRRITPLQDSTSQQSHQIVKNQPKMVVFDHCDDASCLYMAFRGGKFLAI